MINTIKIALSGMVAASKKSEAVASNIANMTTAGALEDPKNAPYSALTSVQTAQRGTAGNGQGVKAEIVSKNMPFVPAYSPDSPFADEKGMIGVPNVDLAEEAVSLNIAKYAYKANLAVIETASEMEEALLNSFDRKA